MGDPRGCTPRTRAGTGEVVVAVPGETGAGGGTAGVTAGGLATGIGAGAGELGLVRNST